MRKNGIFSYFAGAVALFAGFSPAFAEANEAPVCSGYYEDHQTDMYADIGFYAEDFCYDPDGGTLSVSSIGWGPGWQLTGPTTAVLWQIALGQETIPITVTDGQGGVTSFDWVVYRPGY